MSFSLKSSDGMICNRNLNSTLPNKTFKKEPHFFKLDNKKASDPIQIWPKGLKRYLSKEIKWLISK